MAIVVFAIVANVAAAIVAVAIVAVAIFASANFALAHVVISLAADLSPSPAWQFLVSDTFTSCLPRPS